MVNKKCFLTVPLFCFLFSFPAFSSAAEKNLTTITPLESAQIIKENKDNDNFVLVDIRTPREFKQGHIKGARLIDFYSKTFKEKLNALDKNKTYLIYCRSANRTGYALKMMANLGFTRVYNMGKGLNGWKAKRLPVQV